MNASLAGWKTKKTDIETIEGTCNPPCPGKTYLGCFAQPYYAQLYRRATWVAAEV